MDIPRSPDALADCLDDVDSILVYCLKIIAER